MDDLTRRLRAKGTQHKRELAHSLMDNKGPNSAMTKLILADPDAYDDDDILQHHGIKGMKWGVWNDETRARRTGRRFGRKNRGDGETANKGTANASASIPKTTAEKINHYEKIAEPGRFKSGTGVGDQDIKKAEKELGVQFADDYKEFLKTRGWANMHGFTIDGLGPEASRVDSGNPDYDYDYDESDDNGKGFNVIKDTIGRREYLMTSEWIKDSDGLKDKYMVSFDGEDYSYWQNSKGEIFVPEYTGGKEKVYDSLSEMLTECADHRFEEKPKKKGFMNMQWGQRKDKSSADSDGDYIDYDISEKPKQQKQPKEKKSLFGRKEKAPKVSSDKSDPLDGDSFKSTPKQYTEKAGSASKELSKVLNREGLSDKNDAGKGRAVTAGGVDDKTISSAEKELGTKFAPEYKEYLKTYGQVSIDSDHYNGLSKKSLASDTNVVSKTKEYKSRMQMPDEMKDAYMVYSVPVDGISLWQTPKGDLYVTKNNQAVQVPDKTIGDFVRERADDSSAWAARRDAAGGYGDDPMGAWIGNSLASSKTAQRWFDAEVDKLMKG